jgi:hypothetical protein
VLSGKVFKLEEVDLIWRTPWETRPKLGLLSPNKIVMGTGASGKQKKKKEKGEKKNSPRTPSVTEVIKEGFGSSSCCALPLKNRHSYEATFHPGHIQ